MEIEMSLEQKIEDLIAAVNANTAALLAGGAAAPAATTTKAEKTPKAEKAPKADEYTAKHTETEAKAAIEKVKVEKGVPAAKAIIKAAGFDRLADIKTAEGWDKLYDGCEQALAEEDM